MIDWILPFCKVAEAKALPQFQQFLKAEAEFIKHRYNQLFLAAGHESPGVKVLRYILQFVDIDYLDSQTNNYARYSYHLRFIRNDLTNIFDRSARGAGYHSLFFNPSSFTTIEYLIPVEDVNSITGLPLDTDDWSEWRKVRTLRLWANDTDEFTTKLINDRIAYSVTPPNYAIELLDVVALVFKYYIWYKYERINEPAELLAKYNPQQLFIHKYVVCDLIWDLANCWLLRMLAKAVDATIALEDDEIFDSRSLQVDPQYGWIATPSRYGFRSITNLITDIGRNVRPEAIFSSNILYGGSINDRIRLTDNRLVLPISRRYAWMRWMRDKDLVTIWLRIWGSHQDGATAKTIFRNVSRDMKRSMLGKPWDTIQNNYLRQNMETEMNELLEYVDSVRLLV